MQVLRNWVAALAAGAAVVTLVLLSGPRTLGQWGGPNFACQQAANPQCPQCGGYSQGRCTANVSAPFVIGQCIMDPGSNCTNGGTVDCGKLYRCSDGGYTGIDCSTYSICHNN